MDQTAIAPSLNLGRLRWPIVLFAAATGLVPHILLLYHSPAQRLTMILVMHAGIVPAFTALALRLLQRRAEGLEAANAELRDTARDLAQRNRQHDALGAAVRLLSAAPSVAAVLAPLAGLSREVAQADRLRLSWNPPGEEARESEDTGPETAASEAHHAIILQDGETVLGCLTCHGAAQDAFTATSLGLLASEIGLRWRVRRAESMALSAMSAAGKGPPDAETPKRTRHLLKVLCEATGADAAALYLRRTGRWRRRAHVGRADDIDTTPFDRSTGSWRTDGGAFCVKGPEDAVLVLARTDGQAVATDRLDPALLQMIMGHSAGLVRVTDNFQDMLWAERQRIARELHDDVCQSIAALHMQLGHLETLICEAREGAAARCRESREAALEAYEATRLAVDGFRQMPAPDECTAAFLERISRAACDRRGLTLDFRASEIDLTPETAWQLGRVIQEAVGNAARHGGAELIRIDLAGEGASTSLTIRDDGTFRAAKADEDGHYGLAIMAERVGALGGRVSLAPDRGMTCLSVYLPAA